MLPTILRRFIRRRSQGNQIGDVISGLYIYEAFDRTSVFQKNVYSSLGKADLHQYYFSAAVLLLFLMMGVNYGYLYQKQSRAVEEKSEFTVSAKEKCIDQSASYDRSAVACGSFGVCCGLSGIREVSSVFLWFDREVLPGTLLLAAVIAAYFQLIYTISGREHQRNDRAACGQCFSDHGFRCCDPYCISAGTFGKIGTFFPLTFGTAII